MLRQSLRSPMRNGTSVGTVLWLVTFAIVTCTASVDISTPDTPAGHTLQAFLQAFNSADHDRIAAYVKEYDPDENADGLTSFSNQTGGFTLVSIVHSAPDKLTFLVHGRGDNIDAYGTLLLASTAPPRVKHLSIRALPPGARTPGQGPNHRPVPGLVARGRLWGRQGRASARRGRPGSWPKL